MNPILKALLQFIQYVLISSPLRTTRFATKANKLKNLITVKVKKFFLLILRIGFFGLQILQPFFFTKEQSETTRKSQSNTDDWWRSTIGFADVIDVTQKDEDWCKNKNTFIV